MKPEEKMNQGAQSVNYATIFHKCVTLTSRQNLTFAK